MKTLLPNVHVNRFTFTLFSLLIPSLPLMHSTVSTKLLHAFPSRKHPSIPVSHRVSLTTTALRVMHICSCILLTPIWRRLGLSMSLPRPDGIPYLFLSSSEVPRYLCRRIKPASWPHTQSKIAIFPYHPLPNCLNPAPEKRENNLAGRACSAGSFSAQPVPRCCSVPAVVIDLWFFAVVVSYVML